MKTKYLLLLLTAYLTATAAIHARSKQTGRIQEKETIESFIARTTETPSRISSTLLQSFFPQSIAHLATRPKHNQNKTDAFNKAMATFIKSIYNNPNYATALSHDASHVIQFIALCNEYEFSAEQAYTGLRLFTNKFKECEVVDHTVVCQIVRKLPGMLIHYFRQKQKKSVHQITLSKEIEHGILSFFTHHLSLWHSSPTGFITQLSGRLAHDTNQHYTQPSKKEKAHYCKRLRRIVCQLLEVVMGKMMWNPKAYENIKLSFVTIGNGITQLAEKGIIQHCDDLDDLICTLNRRLCFYCDVYGSVLPEEFYDDFQADLSNKALFFLELEEQDPGITSKKQCLARHLIQAKTKAIALQKKGIFSDQIL